MTRPLHCSPFALPALLAATLGLLGACSGTETDNPVVGSSNPVIDGPSNELPLPPTPPPCNSPFLDSGPNFPSGLAQTLLLPAPNPHVLATGRYAGLDLMDISDPAHPTTLSRDVVRGTIQQLLLSASGKLWVAATEPRSFPDSGLPDQPELDAAVHIVELDVSDPRAPLQVAEAQVDGTFWQMQERGDSIWALTARRVAAERDCSYVQGMCAAPSYEAVVLRGFQVDASELTPSAEAELPFDARAFWRPDGVITSLSDGSLHLLTWDAQGSLRTPLELTLGDANHRPGPVDVVGNQLSVIDTSGGRITLRVYDLEAGLDAPQRSADLGPRTLALSEFSLFDSGKLWLSNGYLEDSSADLDLPEDAFQAEAQLWDVSADTPQQIDLTQSFSHVVPITGATLDADPTAMLAIGWQESPSGLETIELLALSPDRVNIAAQLDADQQLQLSAGQNATATPGITGSGSSGSWQLVVRGAGLPLGVDPPAPLPTGRLLAFVGVPLSAASGSSGRQIAEARLFANFGATPSLQITSGNASVSFNVSTTASKLIAMQNALVVAPTCEQPGDDCSGVQGIAVYDLSDPPRLAGELAFPPVPVPDPNYADRASVTWQFLGRLGQDPQSDPVDTSELTLVADVDLECYDAESCAGLGVTPVPSARAGVIAATPACPPGPMGDEPCTPVPPAPSVSGESHLQYFYRLSLDPALSPSWQAIGVSALESPSERANLTSKFASPIVAEDIAGATRLEPLSPSGEALPSGQARIMFDRFPVSPSGNGVTYPPVNVIGYPVARFPDSGSAQVWLSVDAPPVPFGAESANGPAAVHLLYIDQQGAHDAQSLPLPGTFAGAVTLQRDDGSGVPIALTTPADSCGTSQVTAFGLDASGVLQRLSTLELPEDRWSLVAVDGPRVALQRDEVYALVELDGDALSVHSLRSSDGYPQGGRLLGTTLFSIGTDGVRIDF